LGHMPSSFDKRIFIGSHSLPPLSGRQSGPSAAETTVALTSISCAIGVERGQGQASVVMLSVAKPVSFRGERLGFGEQIDSVETKHSGMPRKSSHPWEPASRPLITGYNGVREANVAAAIEGTMGSDDRVLNHDVGRAQSRGTPQGLHPPTWPRHFF
jgi:hypothetical protein